MGEQAKEFEALNAEIICIFREESEGAKGLQKVQDKIETTFTLAVDRDKASTEPYSTKRMTFDNFVIDKTGKVKAIIPGTLKIRATAEQLIKNLKEIESE